MKDSQRATQDNSPLDKYIKVNNERFSTRTGRGVP